MDTQYQKILEEAAALRTQLGQTTDPEQLKLLGKRQAELTPLVEKIRDLGRLEKEIAESTELMGRMDELGKLAETELPDLRKERDALIKDLHELLLPRDPLDQKNLIMEIRAGAGGDESALFAAELFRMYQKFAETQRWKVSLVSSNRIGIGGFKEIIMEIVGAGAYGQLKYESGVHRVQRVPETEKSGRVHTSTVTVAVLPEVEEMDLKIDPRDLKLETTTASGHGGQSVNTTYSAIKITHLPTGITAQSQDERSQTQNREKAMQVLRARVFEAEREKRERELRQKRLSQIGTGDRSEKIRTYNFPQDRVTDHRINQNFGQIQLVMDGELSPLIDALAKVDREAMLKNQTK